MKKTAIVLGATGLTGSYLLDLLLASEDYDKVKVFARRSTGKQNEKLEEIICDLLKLEDYAEEFRADEVFCCIGTTKAKAENKDIYRAIDYGIPVAVARLAEKNGIKSLSIVSAIGANSDSSFFYSRIKGDMEQEVLKHNIENILIYRPSFIYGKREDRRLGEQFAVYIGKVFNFLPFDCLQNYRSIKGIDLAKALFEGIYKHKGHKIIHRKQF